MAKISEMVDVHLSEADQRTFILFIQSADAAKKYADARLYKVGLSTIKLTVLQVLAANGGTMTPSEIARWTMRARHAITTLIARMQKDHLVKVRPSIADGRSVQIGLTDKGRALLSETEPVAIDIVKKIMSSVSGKSLVELENALKILRGNASIALKVLGRGP